MKMTKRIVSVFLAALMAFSCFSLAASAAVAGNVTVDFEYYRAVVKDSVTKWERITADNNKVGRGDVIKARAFIDTNYAAGSQRMFWMYTEGFMDFDTTNMVETVTGNGQWKTTTNPHAESVTSIGGWNYITTFGTEGDQGLAWVLTDDGDGEYEPYVYPDEFIGYDWFCVDTTSGTTAHTLSSGVGEEKYADKNWVYEVEFKISDKATGTGGIVTHEMAIKSPDTDASLSYIAKQAKGDGASFAIGLTAPEANYYNWDISALNEEELSVDNTVTFIGKDGAQVAKFDAYIGGPLSDAAKYADPTITDAAFLGWTPDGGTTVYTTDKDSENYIGNYIVPYEAATLEAVFSEEPPVEESYTVSFKAAADDEEALSEMTDLAKDYELKQDDLDIAAEDLDVPENKEFAYWTLLDGTKVEAGYKVTSDITLIPHYNDVAPSTFSVKFEQADGSEITTLSDLPEGTPLEDIDLEDAAAELDEVDGKHFTGWKIKGTDIVVEAGYVVTTDLVLVPVYADDLYTVTFKYSDDDEESMPDIKHGYKLTADDLDSAADNVVAPVGKKFANWGLADGTDVLAGYEVKSDLVLVPEFEAIKYTVTFYADAEGTTPFEVQTDKYEYKNALEYPIGTPTAPEGKGFGGWNVAAGTEVTENISVTPIFNDLTFTVTFEDGKDGEISSTPDIKYGTELSAEDLEIAAEELPEAEAGKAFAGWKIKGTETVVAEGYAVKTDLVLVPYYTNIKYTVTFYADAEGTTPFETQTDKYEYKNALVYPAGTPKAPEGKYFDGWSVAEGTEVTGNLSVTPIFEALTFTVEFKDAEGEVINTYDSIAWGTEFTAEDLAIEAEDLPAVEGQYFASWQVDGADVTAVTVKSNVVLTPRYEYNTYTVTFKDADGNEIGKVENVVYNTAVSADDVAAAVDNLPSLEGKGLKYTGWDGDTAAAIKADTEFTATTAKETYTVKFVTGVDGETVADLPVAFDEDITAKLEQLSVEGLNFKGWVADLDTKAPAATKIIDLGEDGATVTYYAYWTKTVTFVDGEAETTVEVDKDASILAKAPAFAGNGDDYEAGKWFTEAEGKGTELVADAKATADAAATYYAYYAPKTNLSYTIEIYEEILGKDGEYEQVVEATEIVENATAGDAVVYTKARTGFKAPVLDPADAIVANGLVVKAYYDRIDDITITVNGEPKDYEYGEKLDPAAPETEDGQEFDKWVDKDGNEVKVPTTVTTDMDNLELIATYKYVITFIDQDETTKNDAQAEGATIVAPAEKGITDYAFKGWFTEEEGKGTELTAETKVTGVATYYAYYVAKTDISYSIEIYEEILGKDGEYEQVVEATEIVENATAGDAVVYTKARTGFKAPVLDPADAIVANGLVVKAYYDRIDDITITVNGESKDYEYGEKLDPAAPETEDGQEFDKWVDKDGNEVKVPTTVTTDMDNLELIATYKYVITFIVNGEPVKNDAQAEGATIVAPADPSIKGYTFGGWFTAEDGAGEKLAADAKVTGVATYYAKLDVKKNTVVFKDKDGKVIETVDDVPYGTDLNDILPEAPEVPGQTFAGWVDAETGAPMPETMGDITATYVPSYTSNGTTKYTIETYFMDVDGNYTTKTVATADGTLGTKVTVEDKSDENVGYYLDTEMSVMSVDKLVAGTVLKAYYARNKVTVTFVDYDGITVLGEYTGLYGSKVEYPADPERAFHTFAGWSATPVTAPVTDITITATYNRVPVVLVNNKTTVEGKNVVFNRDNADMMYINGFYVNDLKNKDDYDRYLAVEGDGYFKVVPVANGKYGTGTRIELYDNYDGRLLETYFIVIYGDVDGDANVTSNDISIARDEALGKTSWSDPEDIGEKGQYDAIRTLAADLTGEGNVRNNDVSAITAQVNTTAEINQATREVIYNS